MQTESLSYLSGMSAYLIPGLSAIAALVSVAMVIVNGYLERKRADRRENPDLVALEQGKTEIDRLNDRVSIFRSLANTGQNICTVSDMYIQAHTPKRQRLEFREIDWQSIHPQVRSSGTSTRGVDRRVPFPVFPGGVTRIRAAYLISEQPPETKVRLAGEIVLVYSMGTYPQKELRREWSIQLEEGP